MKVIILAAGYGNRLRPYTNEIPKCMVELAGKPILHHQIDILNAAGFNDILVVGGYFIEKISGKDFKIIKNEKYHCTNMVSSLFCAQEFMSEEEDLLIAYSDIIYEERVLDSLIDTNTSLAISVDKNWMELWKARMDNPLDDAETLRISSGKYVQELGKKPNDFKDIQGQYIGLIKVQSGFIGEFCRTWKKLDRKATYDGKNFDNMYMTSFLQKFINSGTKVEAAFTNGGWLEIDTKSDLDLYRHLHKINKLDKFIKLNQ